MSEPLQLFPPLDRATEAALRASIERFGVLVPVAEDQHRRILDGHHRARIARELGVKYRVDTIRVESDEQAREIAATLNTNRRPRLTGPQLREVMAALLNERRADGVGRHSVNAIAGALGISQKLARDIERELSSTTKFDTSITAREGQDGKVRPARRPTVIPALTETAAGRTAQAALNLPEDVKQPVLDVKRAERIARDHSAAKLRATAVPSATALGDIEIRHGDFREVLADITGVDAIITDPPYPAEYVGLFDGLGELAARILTKDGVLAAMTGQSHLPAYIEHLGRHLTYRWTGAYMLPGKGTTNVQKAAVGNNWKPILIYDKAGKRPFLGTDVWTSQANDKDHHHWGQSESGMAELIQAFTKPGDLVVDPFLGGGTTAVVCRDLGRRFIGCDTDAACIHTASARLSA